MTRGRDLVRAAYRRAEIARHRRGEDGAGIDGRFLELGTDLVLVGDELAACLAEDVEERMAVEVDPDQAAGDAALVAGVGANVGRTHGVDGCLFAGDGIADRLEFSELELSDHRLQIGASERVVRPPLWR